MFSIYKEREVFESKKKGVNINYVKDCGRRKEVLKKERKESTAVSNSFVSYSHFYCYGERKEGREEGKEEGC